MDELLHAALMQARLAAFTLRALKDQLADERDLDAIQTLNLSDGITDLFHNLNYIERQLKELGI